MTRYESRKGNIFSLLLFRHLLFFFNCIGFVSDVRDRVPIVCRFTVDNGKVVGVISFETFL